MRFIPDWDAGKWIALPPILFIAGMLAYGIVNSW